MITSQYSLLSNLIDNASSVRDQVATTQEQIASGHVSDTYSGLGNKVRTSLNLNPAIEHYSTWQSNIDAAQGRLEVTQDALSSVSSVAADFFARVNSLDLQDTGNVQSLALSAKSALQQVAELINSKSGNVYVFSGTDTANPPIPNTDASVVGADVLASDTSQAPFSSTLSTTVPQIEVGEHNWVKVGLLANTNTMATSQAPTTGSYMRDVLKALAGLATLGTNPTAASTTVSNARGLLNSAVTAIGTEAGGLGGVQQSLAAQKTQLSTTATTLKTQLSDVQDVDAAAAISRASTLQLQLQASYQIIAKSLSLSLASYL